MRNWEAAKISYLKGDRPHQLGNLASSLARVKTNIHEGDEVGGQIAIAVIEECQYFTEWTITTLNTMQDESDLILAQELLTLGRSSLDGNCIGRISGKIWQSDWRLLPQQNSGVG